MPKRIIIRQSSAGLTESEYKSQVLAHLKQCKRTTISAWNCAVSKVFPTLNGKNEFGLFDRENLLAMNWSIENRKILPMQLEDCSKNSKKLNSLILTEDNPFSKSKNARFQSIYDIAVEDIKND
jgi:hypothetical protein